MIHFFDPSDAKMAVKAPDIAQRSGRPASEQR
jgi:hypothetical protein